MTFISAKKLPKNFDSFLKSIIHNETHYFGKYINEFLPFLNPRSYIRLIENPSIECLQDSFSGSYPSIFIISLCNKQNTRRQVVLLEYLDIHNLEKFRHLIKMLIQYWKNQQIQEIIFDIPIPTTLLLDKVLCPLSFECIPRLIMVKELSRETLSEDVNDKNIRIILSKDIPTALQCLISAYQNTSWENLHPEVRDDNEGYEFIKNLINNLQDTEFSISLQYILNNQCAGILLGNPIGTHSSCLVHLAIHPFYRRQGIATLLLRKWYQLLIRQGIKNIFLWTHFNNPAVRLYLNEQFHFLYSYPAFYYNSQKNLL